MPSRRPKVPQELAHTVLYKAAHACCVCRDGHSRVQLHHIDRNPANNVEQNLVVLCMPHHDEAEVKGGLTRRLDAAALRHYKAKWETDVRELAKLRVSAANSSSLDMRQWCYFNFTMLLNAARAAQVSPGSFSSIQSARACGILNKEWVPIDTPRAETARTVFDSHTYSHSHALHQAYSELADAVLQAAPPVHLKWAWSRRDLRRLAERNAIVYANRAFRFSVADQPGRRESRIAKYTKERTRLQFLLDTWNVHSVSALDMHFTGYHRVGAVLLLRSAELNEVDGKQLLVVNATPIVCGIGFPPDIDHAPGIAFRDYEGETDVFD